MSNIHYLAVARVADTCRIAQHVVTASSTTSSRSATLFDEKFEKILESPQLKRINRLTIVDHHLGHIHYDADAAFVFLVVTDASYPQRTAFQLLSAAREQFEKQLSTEMSTASARSLTTRGKPIFEHLAQHYSDASKLDKITNVQHQVEQVKGMMQHNIESALHNTENLETLLDISDNMKNDAYGFNRSTTEVKKRMEWKNIQIKLLIAFLVLLIVSLVIGSVVVRAKREQHAA